MIKYIRAYYKKKWCAYAIITLTFISMVKLSWLKCGDLIVDAGREMYVPLQLLSGRVLYRDIVYPYGLFSPYLNAIIFKVFGVTINSLAVSGIITAFLSAILVYRISRFFLGVFFSMFTTLTFLTVFAFGNYMYYGNYNFILPYSYASIHSLLFSLFALYLFFKLLEKQSSRYKYGVAMFVFLCLISKVEIGLFLGITILSTIIILGIAGKDFVTMRINSFVCVILPGILAAGIYGFFWIISGDRIQRSNMLDTYIYCLQLDKTFTANLSGFSNAGGNVYLMFKSFFLYIILCLWFLAGGLASAKIVKIRSLLLSKIVYYCFGFFVMLAGFIFVKKHFSFELQYRSLPFIYLISGIISFISFLKSNYTPAKLRIFSLSLFSFLCALRMLLSLYPGHYGFYILVPGLTIYYTFFFAIMPKIIKENTVKSFFYLGFIIVFTAFIVNYFLTSRSIYSSRNLKVVSERGSLYVHNNDRERRCAQLIDYLSNNTAKDDTVVVLPEGVMINFLSSRGNPLYSYMYLPWDFQKKGLEDDIVDDMQRKKVNYVVLLQRPVEEYGSYHAFGIDYGVRLWQYIKENYVLHRQFGPFPYTTADFGIAVFKARESIPSKLGK